MDPYKAQRMNISQPVQQSKGGRAKILPLGQVLVRNSKVQLNQIADAEQ